MKKTIKKIISINTVFIIISLLSCSGKNTRRNEVISRQNTANLQQRNNLNNTGTSENRNEENTNPQSQNTNENIFNNSQIMVIEKSKKKISIINIDGEIVRSYTSQKIIKSASWNIKTAKAAFLVKDNDTEMISVIGLNSNFTHNIMGNHLSKPAISLNGEFLYYSKFENNTFSVHSFNLENQEDSKIFNKKITNISPYILMSKGNPSVSRDGNFIAFSSYSSNGFDIYIYDKESNITRNITRREGNDYNPVFSPDGKYIAYISKREAPQIFIIRVNRHGRRRLTFIPGVKQSISFSPNGKHIAFVSQYKNRNRIYVMTTSGDDLKILKILRSRIYDCKFLNNNTIVFHTVKNIYSISINRSSFRRIFQAAYSYISLPGR